MFKLSFFSSTMTVIENSKDNSNYVLIISQP